MSRGPHLSCVFAHVCALATAVAACAGEGGAAPPASNTAEALGGSSVCPTGFLGDRSAAPIVELRALRPDGTDVPLVNQGDLALVTPPQGGRVGFVGVRATNIDGCGVQIFVTLRDPISKATRIDGRTVNLRPEAGGFGTSGAALTDTRDYRALGSYAHLPLCPNQWAERDVFDAPFELEVKVVDRDDRTATQAVVITPRCSEPGELGAACRCLCKAAFAGTSTCARDASAP
jgi:hypothetical protein